ncbi:hypothetical protein QQF64_011835 [Cirrhinus molitorella]|uniref:Secreted protein n=1 Tax=Cirrhinus molitorella TaxID=172907 RepID=A0ABR3LUW9_9TELE
MFSYFTLRHCRVFICPFFLSAHSSGETGLSPQEHHPGSSQTMMDTGGRQQPARESWLSNHSARPWFWQGCGGLIISPQKCSVMPLIGFNLVSFSFALRLHLLFASLSRKLL